MDDDFGGGMASGPERRSCARLAVSAEVTLRREGSNNYRVHIFDLSETGCRVETVERPRVAEAVWVKFDGLDAVRATVCWVEPPYAGLEFERAIHPAVFDQLAARLAPRGPPS